MNKETPPLLEPGRQPVGPFICLFRKVYEVQTAPTSFKDKKGLPYVRDRATGVIKRAFQRSNKDMFRRELNCVPSITGSRAQRRAARIWL